MHGNERVTGARKEAACESNLREIFRLIKLREHHGGGVLSLPSNLESLYLMNRDRTKFVCVDDSELRERMRSAKDGAFRTSFDIPAQASKNIKEASPELVAIVFERQRFHSGGRYVLFYDGTVRLLSDEDFAALTKNGFVAKHAKKGPSKN